MKRLFPILFLCILVYGCFPANFNTYSISHYLAEQDKKSGVKYDCGWHDKKTDGTAQRIGLHFGACGTQPVHIFGLELGIFRSNFYWPLFHSTSIGIIGYPGLQFYHSFIFIGAKFDCSEQDFMIASVAFRIHKLSEANYCNEAGS